MTQRLLSKFFDHVETLPKYLERILPDHAKQHIEQTFTPLGSSSSSSCLASGLAWLQESLVGTCSKGHAFDDDMWSSWTIPTIQEVHTGGTISEVRQQDMI